MKTKSFQKNLEQRLNKDEITEIEATRVALLGQTEYINFWLCLGAIVIFSGTYLVLGMRNLKKRLDFV